MVSFVSLPIKGFDNSTIYIIYQFYSKKLNAKWYTLVERMPSGTTKGRSAPLVGG